jgi:hypothetical protein
LCNGEDILWVVGYRINNQFKVTEHTKDILRVDIHMHDKLGQQKSELNKDSKVAENAKKVVDNKKTHVKEVSIKNKTKHNVLEETSENSQNDIKSVGIIPPKKGNTKKKPKNIM